MLKRLAKRIIPYAWLLSLRNHKILSVEFGQLQSMKKRTSIDSKGEPIPWYTYPAIEYIKQLDFSNKSIFEYGSGNSSKFWAKRCKTLVSVEDDREWYSNVKDDISAIAEYRFCESKEAYIQSIRASSSAFDVIIVDGSHRYECAFESINKLRDDGFIILDNSDWLGETSKLLRDADLIEVDMSGFGPINGYTWTTSFYFRRTVKLLSAFDRQPIQGVGGLKQTESK